MSLDFGFASNKHRQERKPISRRGGTKILLGGVWIFKPSTSSDLSFLPALGQATCVLASLLIRNLFQATVEEPQTSGPDCRGLFFWRRYGYWSKPWHLVNPKIAGKWMFIPLELIIIGFDPPPYAKKNGVLCASQVLSKIPYP